MEKPLRCSFEQEEPHGFSSAAASDAIGCDRRANSQAEPHYCLDPRAVHAQQTSTRLARGTRERPSSVEQETLRLGDLFIALDGPAQPAPLLGLSPREKFNLDLSASTPKNIANGTPQLGEQ